VPPVSTTVRPLGTALRCCKRLKRSSTLVARYTVPVGLKTLQIALLVSVFFLVLGEASYAATASVHQTILKPNAVRGRSRRIEGVRCTVYWYMYHHMECTGILTVYDSQRSITDFLLRRLNAKGIIASRWSKAGSPWSDVSTVYLCAASINGLTWVNHTHVLVDVSGLYKNQKLWADEAMEYSATLRLTYTHRNWRVVGTMNGWGRNGE